MKKHWTSQIGRTFLSGLVCDLQKCHSIKKVKEKGWGRTLVYRRLEPHDNWVDHVFRSAPFTIEYFFEGITLCGILIYRINIHILKKNLSDVYLGIYCFVSYSSRS